MAKERTLIELNVVVGGKETTQKFNVVSPTVGDRITVSACRTAMMVAKGREKGPALAELVESAFEACGVTYADVETYSPDEKVEVGLALVGWILGEGDAKNS